MNLKEYLESKVPVIEEPLDLVNDTSIANGKIPIVYAGRKLMAPLQLNSKDFIVDAKTKTITIKAAAFETVASTLATILGKEVKAVKGKEDEAKKHIIEALVHGANEVGFVVGNDQEFDLSSSSGGIGLSAERRTKAEAAKKAKVAQGVEV